MSHTFIEAPEPTVPGPSFRSVLILAESRNRSISLFFRIILRKTASHFCWKCSILSFIFFRLHSFRTDLEEPAP
ncbi:hypothetical protein F9K78_19870 [Brucella pseudintermedia]|nr:hypothetical protein F9K78_19870 [Brucella pseudintermedia]